MIATTLIRRSAPRLAKDFLARQGGVVGTNISHHLLSSAPTIQNYRAFSTVDPSAVVVEPSTITKKVRALNIDVVKKILDDLNAVDVNHDGR